MGYGRLETYTKLDKLGEVRLYCRNETNAIYLLTAEVTANRLKVADFFS